MKGEAIPIYLVRWPDLSASLVRAENEEHLLDILDQEANPEGCEWSVYKGPLAINFRLPAEWSIRDERPGEAVAPEQVVVGDVGPIDNRSVVEAMEVSLAGGDDGADIEALAAARAANGEATNGQALSRIADVQGRVAQGERELQARMRSRLDGVVSIRTLVVGVARAPTASRATRGDAGIRL